MGSISVTKTMTVMDRKPERKDRRQKLKVIHKKIGHLNNGYLNDSDLKTAGVNIQPMSLEEKALLPRFFAPYQAKVDPPQDEYITDSFPHFDDLRLEERADSLQHFLQKFIEHGELPQGEEFPPAPRYKDWGEFGFPDLVEVLGSPRWQLMTAWDMPARKQPHIKCMISTDAAWDERLLYGEIVTIIGIIRQRLRTRQTRAHVDAPVLMYSFLDSGVRIIEANFNGKELVVRATKLYDFKRDDNNKYKLSVLFAKWWHGDAIDVSKK